MNQKKKQGITKKKRGKKIKVGKSSDRGRKIGGEGGKE
jgi:hypothetical protein